MLASAGYDRHFAKDEVIKAVVANPQLRKYLGGDGWRKTFELRQRQLETWVTCKDCTHEHRMTGTRVPRKNGHSILPRQGAFWKRPEFFLQVLWWQGVKCHAQFMEQNLLCSDGSEVPYIR